MKKIAFITMAAFLLFAACKKEVYRSFCRIKSPETLVFSSVFGSQGAWRTF